MLSQACAVKAWNHEAANDALDLGESPTATSERRSSQWFDCQRRSEGSTPGFKGALQTMAAFHDTLRSASPRERARLVATMLKAIAGHRVGDRPGRVEPCANKRRPKKQGYLNEPRKQARRRLMASK